jgi:hypothetical protein
MSYTLLHGILMSSYSSVEEAHGTTIQVDPFITRSIVLKYTKRRMVRYNCTFKLFYKFFSLLL